MRSVKKYMLHRLHFFFHKEKEFESKTNKKSFAKGNKKIYEQNKTIIS